MSIAIAKDVAIEVAQKHEALLRMKKLDLHENAIREFKEEGKLNRSDPAMGNRVGVLYWLTDEETKMVRDWEKETGHLVYHVIKNNLVDIGLCYSFLYVSKDADEWESDNTDLEDGIQFAYVKTLDDYSSEYGTIGIRPGFGGVVRTC